MAIRVRKLAKELQQSPAQVLGLLHHLGYTRYKSDQDMVGGAALSKLRAAARKGIRADPVAPGPTKKTRAAAATPVSGLMDQLVPGVVQQGHSHAADGASGRSDKARRKLEQARAAVDSEREQVEKAQRSVDATRSALEQRQRALDARKTELEREQADLEVERETLHAASPESLAGILSARGLRGFDEQERALAALATRRALGTVLTTLIASDPQRMARILRDKLVLVDGDIGSGFPGLVAVAVSSDRAEVPSPVALAKQLDWIGEQLLLNGLKRLLIIGGSPRWQGLIRAGIDDRIDVVFTLHGRRSEAQAEADVAAYDVIVRWPADVGHEAIAVYERSERVCIATGDDTLKACLDAIRHGLSAL